MPEENNRNISWDDAWDIINETLEQMDNEYEMIPMIQGQLSYVMSCYVKREHHDTMIFDIVEDLRKSLAEDEKIFNRKFEKDSSGNA